MNTTQRFEKTIAPAVANYYILTDRHLDRPEAGFCAPYWLQGVAGYGDGTQYFVEDLAPEGAAVVAAWPEVIHMVPTDWHPGDGRSD